MRSGSQHKPRAVVPPADTGGIADMFVMTAEHCYGMYLFYACPVYML